MDKQNEKIMPLGVLVVLLCSANGVDIVNWEFDTYMYAATLGACGGTDSNDSNFLSVLEKTCSKTPNGQLMTGISLACSAITLPSFRFACSLLHLDRG